MRLLTVLNDARPDMMLEGLLARRKAPLSEEGIRRTLEQLTLKMTEDVRFYAAVFPKKDAYGKDVFTTSEIEKMDIMYADDGSAYMPVFSTVDKLHAFKAKPDQGEVFCILNKADILSFLNQNGKVAAAVLNPYDDDLPLYRVQLQNFIRIEADRKAGDA